ncbi:MAG TPA: hypothetical protein VKA84_05715 [Gemmatimonadaceae bacterium]|nr:hypothetical protein [Gemmatimonadaceae bacterium]
MTQPPLSPEQLRPVLQAAEEELSERLKLACDNKAVSEETTGELMRLEENLVDAAQAAKHAISIRRRIRTQRAADSGAPSRPSVPPKKERRSTSAAAGASPLDSSLAAPPPAGPVADAPPVDAAAAPPAPPAPATPAAEPAAGAAGAADLPRPAMREFKDRSGKEWRVWAVTPEQMHRRTRTEAYMAEYRDGWLAFESIDGSDRRRLPHYPADWDQVGVEELERLMSRAEVARGRKISPPRGSDVTER